MSRLKEPTRVCPNMVPMIDIVSQLVVFFMMASTFISADVDTSIRLPELVDSVAGKHPPGQFDFVINMVADPANPRVVGKLQVGATNVTEAASRQGQGKGALDILMEKLQAAKDKAQREGGQLTVIIRADKRLYWPDVQSVLQQTARAGIRDVQLSGPLEGPAKKDAG